MAPSSDPRQGAPNQSQIDSQLAPLRENRVVWAFPGRWRSETEEACPCRGKERLPSQDAAEAGMTEWCGWRGSNPRPLASENKSLASAPVLEKPNSLIAKGKVRKASANFGSKTVVFWTKVWTNALLRNHNNPCAPAGHQARRIRAGCPCGAPTHAGLRPGPWRST